MKNLWVLLICLTCVTSAFAETEYMCGGISFVPNKSPEYSCGSYCAIGRDNYVKNLYPKAKAMYDNGQCSKVNIVKSYIDAECGGMAYEKSTASGMKWTEYVGGNSQCRINRNRKRQQQRMNEVIYGK